MSYADFGLLGHSFFIILGVVKTVEKAQKTCIEIEYNFIKKPGGLGEYCVAMG